MEIKFTQEKNKEKDLQAKQCISISKTMHFLFSDYTSPFMVKATNHVSKRYIVHTSSKVVGICWSEVDGVPTSNA